MPQDFLLLFAVCGIFSTFVCILKFVGGKEGIA